MRETRQEHAPLPQKPLRTQFSMKALDISDVFTAEFKDIVLPGKTNRHARLIAPEGQSTGGGAQAVQSVTLEPDDPRAGTMVAGTVNAYMMTAELRGFPYLNDTHRMRYDGKPIDISADAYQMFLVKAEEFFKKNGYQVSVHSQLPEAAKRHYERSVKTKSGSSTLLVVILFLVLAAAGVAVFLLLRK